MEEFSPTLAVRGRSGVSLLGCSRAPGWSLPRRAKQKCNCGERLRRGERHGHGGARRHRFGVSLPRIPPGIARFPSLFVVLQMFVKALVASGCFGCCRGLGVFWELSL